MHLYIVSGILLIVPIIDFSLAAPVLVQEKRQAYADMIDIPAYPITVLGKRGEVEEVGGKYIEKWFVPAKESSAAHGSSSSTTSEPGHVSMSVIDAPAPNPGPSTESDHLLTPMHTPQSSTVHPTWFNFDPNSEWLGPQVSQPNTVHALPNTGPSNPSTKFDSDHSLVAPPPPSQTKGSSTESDIEMEDFPPSSTVSSTAPNRDSMNADSQLENLQTDRDALKGQAKESRRNSGNARDLGNAAQGELQPEKSHDSNEPEA
jgi:hypothetical protein